MAAVLRRLSLTPYFVLQSQRTFSVAVTLNNKNVVSGDPIKKLFIDKLNEFNKKKVPMTPQVKKEYEDEMERLKRVFGGNEKDLSQFPTFKYDK